MMLLKEKGGIRWLEFEQLSCIPNLVHGVVLRSEKREDGTLSSLNLGGALESSENIGENRQKVWKALGIPKAVWVHQVHSDDLICVTGPDFSCIEKADGLMTQIPGLGLMIRHADCQAALFYDVKNRALANVHAGWRGNVKNIYGKTVEQMGETFGTDPQNLLVCISPSLGPSCSEFIHFERELPSSFWEYQIKPTYFDLWKIARMQLEASGVLPEHIEIASICTICSPDDFFSYRRDKVQKRNNATIAALL
ncbi:MAG: peptidoglycan editing factor PgeF [Chlamydiales bacterium]|nr:peptidoglycan editing factor PgeF [Chlamydiales bacterium]